MDMRKIRKLIDLIKKTGIAKIEVREGDSLIRITSENHQIIPPTRVLPSAPLLVNESPAVSSPVAATAAVQSETINKHTVSAPMVGTVYLSPSPGASPF